MSNFYANGAAAMTSNRDDWETPQALYDELDAKYHFTLDAASSDSNAKCPRHLTKEDDALAVGWDGETVWLNPPYGRDMARWVEKASAEAGRGTRIVMLVPARTDTRWFHDHIYHKARVEFIRGRLKYELGGRSQQSAPFPSMLVYFNC